MVNVQLTMKPSAPLFLMMICDFRADQGRLLDYIVSWGNLTEEKVASYLRSVLEALHYLHNCRIVHLDIKVSIGFSIKCA